MLDYRSFSAVREGGLQEFNVQGSSATFGEYKVDRHRQARGDELALHQKCLTINWNRYFMAQKDGINELAGVYHCCRSGHFSF
jgi:hypothetical protein